jgi:hypothetical protein
MQNQQCQGTERNTDSYIECGARRFLTRLDLALIVPGDIPYSAARFVLTMRSCSVVSWSIAEINNPLQFRVILSVSRPRHDLFFLSHEMPQSGDPTNWKSHLCRLPHFPELRTLTNGIEQRVFLHCRIGTVVPLDGLTNCRNAASGCPPRLSRWSRRESCAPPAESRVGPDRENHVLNLC